MATYRNPWFKSDRHNGPEFFSTNARPVEYAGYALFEVIKGKPGRSQWDITKDGVCVSQRASRDGAKGWVDILNNMAARGFTYTSTEWAFTNAAGEIKHICDVA
jgi:hypothetical protein